ncbi:MAG: prolipoprotein diacylglyceryl transferase [Candidatus Hydrogenedentes bacterium]|nr:prolipoprotein diacylglyceryl transferase [Candidatus Hydrogenedentota bacterium]
MHPVLATVWGIPIHTWPLIFATGVSLGWWGAIRASERARHSPLPPALGVLAFLGAVIGAKALALVLGPYGFSGGVSLFDSGFAELGGLAGGAITSCVYLRRRRIAILPVFDVMAPYAAVSLAFIRLGCFFNGCCRGTPSDLPWAVRFPQAEVASGSALASFHAATLHPVQLYYSLFFLLLFALLCAVETRWKRPGTKAYVFLIAFLAVKFTLECVRQDDGRYFLGLNFSQVAASFAILGVAAWTLAMRLCGNRRLAM